MTLVELKGLWHGDEWSMGYAHEWLAAEIARRSQAQSSEQLVGVLYGSAVHLADLDVETQRIVSAGWKKSRELRRRPRVIWKPRVL